jgi:hypothetical protein
MCYLLIGFTLYIFFTNALEEAGGIDFLLHMIDKDDEEAKKIDFNSPHIKFIMFLMLLLLWPFLIIAAFNHE